MHSMHNMLAAVMITTRVATRGHGRSWLQTLHSAMTARRAAQVSTPPGPRPALGAPPEFSSESKHLYPCARMVLRSQRSQGAAALAPPQARRLARAGAVLVAPATASPARAAGTRIATATAAAAAAAVGATLLAGLIQSSCSCAPAESQGASNDVGKRLRAKVRQGRPAAPASSAKAPAASSNGTSTAPARPIAGGADSRTAGENTPRPHSTTGSTGGRGRDHAASNGAGPGGQAVVGDGASPALVGDGESAELPESDYALPPDYDLDKACQESAHCDACVFFCGSPCREAYFRSIECYTALQEHGYKGQKVTDKQAADSCSHFTWRCWAVHKDEMGRLAKKAAAAVDSSSSSTDAA